MKSISPGAISRKRRNSWAHREAVFEHFRSKKAFARWDEQVLHDYIDHGTFDADDARALSFDRDVETAIYNTLPHNLGALLRAHPLKCKAAFIGGRQSAEMKRVGMLRHAAEVAGRAGGIDIALNAIGIVHVQGTPLAELPLEDFFLPVRAYTRSCFLTAKAVAPHMRRGLADAHRHAHVAQAGVRALGVGGRVPFHPQVLGPAERGVRHVGEALLGKPHDGGLDQQNNIHAYSFSSAAIITRGQVSPGSASPVSVMFRPPALTHSHVSGCV